LSLCTAEEVSATKSFSVESLGWVMRSVVEISSHDKDGVKMWRAPEDFSFLGQDAV
jgi:hypothetical protein